MSWSEIFAKIQFNSNELEESHKRLFNKIQTDWNDSYTGKEAHLIDMLDAIQTYYLRQQQQQFGGISYQDRYARQQQELEERREVERKRWQAEKEEEEFRRKQQEEMELELEQKRQEEERLKKWKEEKYKIFRQEVANGTYRIIIRIRPMVISSLTSRESTSYNQPFKIKPFQSYDDLVPKQVILSPFEQSPTKYFHVFGEENTNADVYQDVSNFPEFFLSDRNQNIMIMAYGQSGSGKTHTIFGTDDDPGIIYNSIDEIFKLLEDRNDKNEIQLQLSVLEFTITFDSIKDRHYTSTEKIYDLLAESQLLSTPSSSKTQSRNKLEQYSANIRQDLNQHNYRELIGQAQSKRTTASTINNDASSRSHCVIELYKKHGQNTSRFVFIDLAGSENIGDSRSVGDIPNEMIRAAIPYNDYRNMITAEEIQTVKTQRDEYSKKIITMQGTYINHSLSQVGSILSGTNTLNQLNPYQFTVYCARVHKHIDTDYTFKNIKLDIPRQKNQGCFTAVIVTLRPDSTSESKQTLNTINNWISK